MLKSLFALFKGVEIEPTIESWVANTKPEVIPKKSVTNQLTIHFDDNTTLSWSVIDFVGKSKIETWKEFYHWYFGRHGSEYFIFRYKGGETMFRRKDIKRFNVVLINVVEQVKVAYDEYTGETHNDDTNADIFQNERYDCIKQLIARYLELRPEFVGRNYISDSCGQSLQPLLTEQQILLMNERNRLQMSRAHFDLLMDKQIMLNKSK